MNPTILLVFAVSCGTRYPPSGTGVFRPTNTKANEDFVIGRGDVLAVAVWKEPELSAQDLVVRPDGIISLPLIDEIRAGGLTSNELRELIAEKLEEFVAAPNVTVFITQVNSRSVSVVGQVGSPGVYPLRRPTTILELLARAGGFVEYAKTKDIKILRKEGGQTKAFKFNFKDVAKGKKIEQNILLKTGDIIIVP
jgi:polysaccharide export outer membrane protein